MKSNCVLPPLSDILNPYHPYNNHINNNNSATHTQHRRPLSHSMLQVSNLLSQKDYYQTTTPEDSDEDYDDSNEPVKAKRKRASPSQLTVLNRVFQQTFFPSTELRMELGKQLGMSPRTVQIWFQNKRQSIRTRERSNNNNNNIILSPPISPSLGHYSPVNMNSSIHLPMSKPMHINLPPLRLPSHSNYFPLTPTSSVHSSPTSFDSILFRD